MARLLAILLLLLATPAAMFAQPAITDVIPKEASAAIVLRSVHDFKVKGKKLLNDLDVQQDEAFDMIVGQVLQALRLQEGLDTNAPVVLALLDVTLMPDAIVLMAPIADREKILAGYKLAKQPKDGEIVRLEDGGGFISPQALLVRDRYLYLALSEAALKRVSGKSLAVSAAEKKQFGDADVLAYVGKQSWPLLWGDYLGRLGTYFDRHKDEEEKKIGSLFVKGMRAAEHSFIGLRVQDGVRLRSNIVFDVKAEKAAKEMLDILRSKNSRSSLKGLPDGRALAALGWAADGSKNGILTKLLFDVFLEGPLPGKLNDLPVFASTDYPTAVGVTHELAQRLKGARVGLYHNLNAKELGLVSAIAVFDTADGPAFLKEVRSLAKLANLKADDLKFPEVQKLVDLEKLVRDLDSGTFSVRQSATTRLLLIGEPSLPHLQKALDKPMTLEQKRRAEGIKQEIDRAAEQGRKDLLLPKGMPKALRATFAVAPEIEKRDGVSVDVLEMTFNTKNVEFLKQMMMLLGPNWDKIRLAVVGNQVVVLVGSDVTLLDLTVANLKAGKGGLADSKVLTEFAKRAEPDRTAEMHGSAQGFLGLLAKEWKLPAKLFRDAPGLTSLAISFGDDRLEFDLWVPTRELRTMVHTILPGL